MTYKRKQYDKAKRNPYARELLRPLSKYQQRVVKIKKNDKLTKAEILEELNYEGEIYEES